MKEKIIIDPKYIGVDGDYRFYKDICCAITARDYKDPLRVLEYERRQETNQDNNIVQQ